MSVDALSFTLIIAYICFGVSGQRYSKSFERPIGDGFKVHHDILSFTRRQDLDVLQIGALVEKTGSFSEVGLQLVEGYKLAADRFREVNLYSEVDLVVQDTESNPDIALEKFKDMYDAGIRIFVGPGTSSATEVVAEYALENAEDAFFIVSSATSKSLRQYSNVFRTSMSDDFQAKALASSIEDVGVRKIIIVYRDDVYGKGLFRDLRDSIKLSFNQKFIKGIKYDVSTDFKGSDARDILKEIADTIGDFKYNNYGIVLISFSEGVKILRQASKQPNFNEAKWFGADGITLSSSLTTSSSTYKFASEVNFKGTLFSGEPMYSDDVIQFTQSAVADTDFLPSPYALLAHDAMLLIYDTGLVHRTVDVETIKLALLYESEFQYGLSGRLHLSNERERIFGAYRIYSVLGEDEVFNGFSRWVIAGSIGISAVQAPFSRRRTRQVQLDELVSDTSSDGGLNHVIRKKFFKTLLDNTPENEELKVIVRAQDPLTFEIKETEVNVTGNETKLVLPASTDFTIEVDTLNLRRQVNRRSLSMSCPARAKASSKNSCLFKAFLNARQESAFNFDLPFGSSPEFPSSVVANAKTGRDARDTSVTDSAEILSILLNILSEE